MKFTMDLVLILLLLILFYQTDSFLATSVLGRVIAVGLISYVALCYGRNAGLLASLIFILAMHNRREGLSNKTPKDKKKSSKHETKKVRSIKEGIASKGKSGSPSPSPAPSPTPSPAPSPSPSPSAASSPSPGAAKHPLSHLLNKSSKPSSSAKVKERIQNILNSKKKSKVSQTHTNKTDIENKIQKESYRNSQAARGQHGGKGFIRKLDK